MASPSESGASSEDVVEWVHEASSRLHSLEVQCRHLNALCNTLQLRLDEMQSDLDRVRSQLQDERGITLAARVDALAQVLTQAVEICNRVEPEVRLLLQWRQRFTSSLQTQLCYALAQVLTQAVEICNRVEPEVRLLLQWRQRFTSSLQTQLCYLGHQFALICPRLDLQALD